MSRDLIILLIVMVALLLTFIGLASSFYIENSGLKSSAIQEQASFKNKVSVLESDLKHYKEDNALQIISFEKELANYKKTQQALIVDLNKPLMEIYKQAVYCQNFVYCRNNSCSEDNSQELNEYLCLFPTASEQLEILNNVLGKVGK